MIELLTALVVGYAMGCMTIVWAASLTREKRAKTREARIEFEIRRRVDQRWGRRMRDDLEL